MQMLPEGLWKHYQEDAEAEWEYAESQNWDEYYAVVTNRWDFDAKRLLEWRREEQRRLGRRTMCSKTSWRPG
jgi:hypothetical protein